MWKHAIALSAGIAAFLPQMALGETIGDIPMLVFTAVYFFVCQFFLSRGHERAYADWSLMLALDASTLVLLLFLADGGPTSPINLRWLLCTLGGTFAGALAAALMARSGRSGLLAIGPIPRPLVAGAGALVCGLAGFVIGAVAVHGQVPGPPIGAFVGLGLGAALGAYVADRRRGRWEFVLPAALVIAIAGWSIPSLVGAIGGFWTGPPLFGGTAMAAAAVAAALETSTTRHRHPKVGAA